MNEFEEKTQRIMNSFNSWDASDDESVLNVRTFILEILSEVSQAARKEERERCAGIARSFIDEHTFNDKTFQWNDCASGIASAIEALKEKRT